MRPLQVQLDVQLLEAQVPVVVRVTEARFLIEGVLEEPAGRLHLLRRRVCRELLQRLIDQIPGGTDGVAERLRADTRAANECGAGGAGRHRDQFPPRHRYFFGAERGPPAPVSSHRRSRPCRWALGPGLVPPGAAGRRGARARRMTRPGAHRILDRRWQVRQLDL